MIDALAAIAALETCGTTHVVWIPDSYFGTWESALANSDAIKIVRPAREGEAIAIAAGLMLGGARPIVIIQCTGFFEAGDALRNIVHDLQLPLMLLIGVRGYLAREAGMGSDNCPTFMQPILDAWKLDSTLIDPGRHSASDLIAAIRGIQRSGRAGAILIAE